MCFLPAITALDIHISHRNLSVLPIRHHGIGYSQGAFDIHHRGAINRLNIAQA